MARVSYLALLAVAFGGLCIANPAEEQQLLSELASDKWSWSDCGKPHFPVHIQSIELSPDPPKTGEELTVTVTGKATERVEDGAYADVSVKVGVIKILQKEFDVCEEARNANASIQCPVEEGTHKVAHTVELPKEIPPAIFSVSIRGYTAEDDDMVCLDLKIDFRKQPGSFFGW